MAIFENKVPLDLISNPNFNYRVIVKFKPDIQLPYNAEVTFDNVLQPFRSAWTALKSQFKDLHLIPYFATIQEDILRQFVFEEKNNTKKITQATFLQYFSINCSSRPLAEVIATELRSWPMVITAYVEGDPAPPPISPNDDPLSRNQGYLNAAPAGIDASSLWQRVDGSGVGFVDLEQGWTLDHVDLMDAGITIISGVNKYYHGHGTAVLGVVSAVDNQQGGIGIAPGATTRVVSQWRTATETMPKTAEAILSAVGTMEEGDILLLEAQAIHPVHGYVPVEVEQAVFDAIFYATSQRGIVVVEAAGNGSNDLDVFQDYNGRQVLNRTSTDFLDSGAIMIGAATSRAPHRRMHFSNFGSRIDCFAWGENISTCGDGWDGTGKYAYTSSFNGTSGASPIIAGAALLMQSWGIKVFGRKYKSSFLRDWLSDSNLHTKSFNPSTDRIGVMPNLQKLLDSG